MKLVNEQKKKTDRNNIEGIMGTNEGYYDATEKKKKRAHFNVMSRVNENEEKRDKRDNSTTHQT